MVEKGEQKRGGDQWAGLGQDPGSTGRGGKVQGKPRGCGVGKTGGGGPIRCSLRGFQGRRMQGPWPRAEGKGAGVQDFGPAAQGGKVSRATFLFSTRGCPAGRPIPPQGAGAGRSTHSIRRATKRKAGNTQWRPTRFFQKEAVGRIATPVRTGATTSKTWSAGRTHAGDRRAGNRMVAGVSVQVVARPWFGGGHLIISRGFSGK